MKNFAAIALIVVLAVVAVLSFAYGIEWLEAPPDGPIVTTLAGEVIERNDVYSTNLVHTWYENWVIFKEDGDNGWTYYFTVNPRHRIDKQRRCKITYQEQWHFFWNSLSFRRQSVILAIEMAE